MTDDELLKYLYHTKKSFGGVQQLYDKAKIQHPSIKKSFVKEWIENQKGYQLNKIKKLVKKYICLFILRHLIVFKLI